MRKKMKASAWKDTSMSIWTKILITAMMIFLTITFLYPLFYLIVNSFKTNTDYYINQFNIPTQLYWGNYEVMLKDFKILRYFANTAIVTVAGTVIIIMLSVFASYAFAKIQFRFRAILYIAVLSTMFLPGQATMIPQYVMFSKYGLINNYWSVILAAVAGSLPGSILLLRSSFVGIPDDLLESAKIDGAGYFSTVFNVAVPLTMAAISIQIIFSFIGQWNTLLTPMLLLTDANKMTIMVALSNLMTRYSSKPALQMTGLFISVLPVVVLYLFLQKYMMKGMLVGAVKT